MSDEPLSFLQRSIQANQARIAALEAPVQAEAPRQPTMDELSILLHGGTVDLTKPPVEPEPNDSGNLATGSFTLAETKPKNFRAAIYSACHMTVAMAYWQGLPYLSLADLESLTLTKALQLVKAKKVGWRSLAAQSPATQTAVKALAQSIVTTPSKLFTDKEWHKEIALALASRGVPITKEQALSRTKAQAAMDEWKGAALAFCKENKISDPRDYLDSKDSSAALTPVTSFDPSVFDDL